MIKIIFRAADKAKKVALKEALICQIHSQGKREPSLQPRIL
jgi:hypothetical protein